MCGKGRLGELLDERIKNLNSVNEVSTSSSQKLPGDQRDVMEKCLVKELRDFSE
jgi:hypothetical protein